MCNFHPHDMWLSHHFIASEFACPCCELSWVGHKLVQRLERLRGVVGRPIHINSGCRCPVHNEEEIGGRNSYHLNGMAADISFVGLGDTPLWEYINEFHTMSGESIYDYILDEFDGVIFYPDFIHVDVRGYKWSQTKTEGKK